MKTFAVYFLYDTRDDPPSVIVKNIQATDKTAAKKAAFAELRHELVEYFGEENEADCVMEDEYNIVSIVEVVEPAEIEEHYWPKDSE